MATNHKFIIEPHFRLQEWIAEEKGYFKDEGLDYIFREMVQSTDGKIHDKGNKVGAFQSFEEGRKSDVSCACHWTVNVAAASGHGRLNRDVYSVAPSGIFVAPDSPIKTPADLAGVPISVGFQSGSHYASIQALESYMPKDQIKLSFNDGMLFKRMEMLLDGQVPAATLVLGAVLSRRATRLPQDHGQHLHDRQHDPRRSRSGRSAQVFHRAEARAARPRSAAGTLHALLHERVSEALARRHGYAPLGSGRAASCSSRIPKRRLQSRATGSPITTSSRAATSARSATRMRPSA